MQIESVQPDTLIHDPSNVRQHDERNIEAIKASLARFGQQKPIVVDGDGIVVAGNGTLQAVRELGWEEINIVRTQLKGVEAIAFAIADNRTAELAIWDNDNLGELLSSIKESEVPLESTGFDEADLATLLGGWDIAPSETPDQEYTPEQERFLIKVENVHNSDKQPVVDLINKTLTDAGYSYESKAY